MSARAPHTLGCALCLGLAGATVARVGLLPATLVATALIALAAAARSRDVTLALAGFGMALAGWGLGSARLVAIDRSSRFSNCV